MGGGGVAVSGFDPIECGGSLLGVKARPTVNSPFCLSPPLDLVSDFPEPQHWTEALVLTRRKRREKKRGKWLTRLGSRGDLVGFLQREDDPRWTRML